MRAVVTGATGFVGAAVVRALLREDAQVVCLVRRGSEVRHLRDPRITLMEGDLLDEASLRRAFRGCEQVYHVAAFYSTRAEDEGRLFEVNVGGTANVLRAAEEAGAQRIVHTSTIGTIGRPAGRLPTEADRFQNIERASPYARSKLEAEQLALESAERGLPVVVVNPCAPVGVGDVKPSSTGQRIVAYLRGRVPSFPAGGINFVSVEDVAVGHLLAARKGRVGERYILGNAEGNLSLIGFYALMERVSGQAPPGSEGLAPLRRLRGAIRRWRQRRASPASGTGFQPEALTADPRRAIYELGLPQTPLTVAFREAVEWFRAHGYG